MQIFCIMSWSDWSYLNCAKNIIFSVARYGHYGIFCWYVIRHTNYDVDKNWKVYLNGRRSFKKNKQIKCNLRQYLCIRSHLNFECIKIETLCILIWRIHNQELKTRFISYLIDIQFGRWFVLSINSYLSYPSE